MRSDTAPSLTVHRATGIPIVSQFIERSLQECCSKGFKEYLGPWYRSITVTAKDRKGIGVDQSGSLIESSNIIQLKLRVLYCTEKRTGKWYIVERKSR